MNRPSPLDSLGVSARSLLEACAMLGESFTFSQLFSILGDPLENGTARFVRLHGWEELRRSSILACDDPHHPENFRFTDPEVRAGVLANLNPSERSRLQERITASVW